LSTSEKLSTFSIDQSYGYGNINASELPPCGGSFLLEISIILILIVFKKKLRISFLRMLRYLVFLAVFIILGSGANIFASSSSDISIERENYFDQESRVSSKVPEEKEILFTGGNSILATNEPLIFEEIGTFKITAYSSTIGQTDDTPFIMASGKHVYDGAVAANFLPLGTKVKFPDLYGEKIFTVEDRMHERFQDRIDIWFETQTEARSFGMKRTRVEIVR